MRKLIHKSIVAPPATVGEDICELIVKGLQSYFLLYGDRPTAPPAKEPTVVGC